MDVVGRSAMFRAVLVGVLCGASPCTGAPGGNDAASGASATPESAGGVRSSLSGADGVGGVQAVGSAARQGERQCPGRWRIRGRAVRQRLRARADLAGREDRCAICSASPGIATRGCVPLADIIGRQNPGVGIFLGGSLCNGQWLVMLRPAVRRSIRSPVKGGPSPRGRRTRSMLTVCSTPSTRMVAIPRRLQGEYRAAVRRDGAPVEDRVALDMEKISVQCRELDLCAGAPPP